MILPEKAGKVCCGDDSAARIITAMRSGVRTAELDLIDATPTFTAAEAAKLGIIEEVGHPDVFGPTTSTRAVSRGCRTSTASPT